MLRALGQLAARELGVASRPDAAAPLAPRLPARYETVPAAAMDTDAPATPGRLPAASDESPSPPLDVPRARIDASPDIAPPTAALPASPAAATPVVALEPVAPAPMPQPRRAVAPPATRTLAAARAAATTQDPRVPPQARLRARDDHEPAPRESVDAPAHSSRPIVHAATMREAVKPAREGTALRPLLPPRMPPRDSAPPAAAPVHVTIGRIEIRAAKEALAEAAPSPRRANPPSLAAYLRRRSDGGRS